MRSSIAAVAIATAAAALGACGGPGITTGLVTAKRYERAYTEQIPVQHCVQIGTNICGAYFFTYLPDHHRACWHLSLRQGKRTGGACVSQHTFEETNVGDSYDPAP